MEVSLGWTVQCLWNAPQVAVAAAFSGVPRWVSLLKRDLDLMDAGESEGPIEVDGLNEGVHASWRSSLPSVANATE
jgi:hypothetical protein